MSKLGNIDPPIIDQKFGSYHPINETKLFLINFFKEIGFQEVYGPEIETERFNFDMLNIKKSHPALQMHYTFYFNDKSSV